MPVIPTYTGGAVFQSGYQTGKTAREIYEDKVLREEARFQAQQELDLEKMAMAEKNAALDRQAQAERDAINMQKWEADMALKYDKYESDKAYRDKLLGLKTSESKGDLELLELEKEIKRQEALLTGAQTDYERSKIGKSDIETQAKQAGMNLKRDKYESDKDYKDRLLELKQGKYESDKDYKNRLLELKQGKYESDLELKRDKYESDKEASISKERQKAGEEALGPTYTNQYGVDIPIQAISDPKHRMGIMKDKYYAPAYEEEKKEKPLTSFQTDRLINRSVSKINKYLKDVTYDNGTTFWDPTAIDGLNEIYNNEINQLKNIFGEEKVKDIIKGVNAKVDKNYEYEDEEGNRMKLNIAKQEVKKETEKATEDIKTDPKQKGKKVKVKFPNDQLLYLSEKEAQLAVKNDKAKIIKE